VAHDLQTPLRTISTVIQLLSKRFESAADHETQELSFLIVSGAERGKRLIGDLLDYSRVIEDGHNQLGPVDTTALAAWAVDTSRRRSTKTTHPSCFRTCRP